MLKQMYTYTERFRMIKLNLLPLRAEDEFLNVYVNIERFVSRSQTRFTYQACSYSL